MPSRSPSSAGPASSRGPNWSLAPTWRCGAPGASMSGSGRSGRGSRSWSLRSITHSMAHLLFERRRALAGASVSRLCSAGSKAPMRGAGSSHVNLCAGSGDQSYATWPSTRRAETIAHFHAGSVGSLPMTIHVAYALACNAALDALKAIHTVEVFYIAGQGGHSAAALLALRRDIACAVIASAPASTHVYDMERGFTVPPGEFFDPAVHVGNIASSSPPRIFILADPRD